MKSLDTLSKETIKLLRKNKILYSLIKSEFVKDTLEKIHVDKKENCIRVGYCKFTKLGNNPVNDMVAEIVGKTAIEIINTLIRENYISSLQHAGDMGIELYKAELALKNDLNYTQDKDLSLKK